MFEKTVNLVIINILGTALFSGVSILLHLLIGTIKALITPLSASRTSINEHLPIGHK